MLLVAFLRFLRVHHCFHLAFVYSYPNFVALISNAVDYTRAPNVLTGLYTLVFVNLYTECNKYYYCIRFLTRVDD